MASFFSGSSDDLLPEYPAFAQVDGSPVFLEGHPRPGQANPSSSFHNNKFFLFSIDVASSSGRSSASPLSRA